MGFALIFVGLLLTVTAVRNTYSQLFSLVVSDFTGSGNFFYWAVVVIALGAIGYIKPLRPLSWALLTLLVLVLILSKGSPTLPGGGLFSQLTSELQKGTTAANAASVQQTPADQGTPVLTVV
jgi:hypothetical protein